ncbi:hypothetical protein [Gloeobacter morelensis]|uniref:Uncharacterized protein n=1 Tax=Gloeobacter morelensis MG652769 TaxID=2781736 RepID=A0ABY3PNK1_9CYAN|nr:hypothetical protein [Gloeobacter morelensis]UFP95194.1 hypothetical protein ISF26_02785 [Gloeobacter morelensis MG652769]
MALSEEQVARRALAIRIKQQLTELSKEMQKWQGYVQLAKTQNRLEMASQAEQRIAELTERARALWKQRDELLTEERFAELEIDDALAALKRQVQKDDGVTDAEFEEIDDELEQLKRRAGSERPPAS